MQMILKTTDFNGRVGLVPFRMDYGECVVLDPTTDALRIGMQTLALSAYFPPRESTIISRPDRELLVQVFTGAGNLVLQQTVKESDVVSR